MRDGELGGRSLTYKSIGDGESLTSLNGLAISLTRKRTKYRGIDRSRLYKGINLDWGNLLRGVRNCVSNHTTHISEAY